MLRNYPKSGGPVPRPIVGVHPAVVDALGMPKVDNKGLAELFYDGLKVPADIEPVVNLRPLSKVLLGYHAVFSHEIHVDPLKTEREDIEYSTTELLVHEGKHLSDSLLHPLGMAANLVAKLGVLGTGTYLGYRFLGQDLGASLPTGWVKTMDSGPSLGPLNLRSEVSMLASMVCGGVATQAYYLADPMEIRARVAQKSELLATYDGVITFPDAPPTTL